MEISAQGIGSGLDIGGIVEQLVAAERAPVGNRLNLQEARANSELSAIGTLKSGLATFRDAVATLSDLAEFQKRTTAVDVEGLISGIATSAAVPGSYDIEVLSLASIHKLASQAFADTVTPIGTGTLSITVDGQTSDIDIVDGTNTLADIRNAINAAGDNPGVLATIVTADDGAHLIVTSQDTGVDQEITITASGGDGGLTVFEFDPGPGPPDPMTEQQSASDASLEIDGFAITSARNTVSNAIDGVTIDLLGAAPGTLTTLQIGLDQDAAKAAVNTFVDAYNELVGTIAELTAFDAENNIAGPLLGDATTRGVKSALRRELSESVSNTGAVFSTLAEIGITTQTDGTLELDDDKLTAAISSDFDAVGQLFAQTDNGIAVRMDAILGIVLDGDGQIESREGTLQERLERIADQREVLDRRMEAVRERLQRQFNAMDQLVAQLNNTSSFLSQQLSRLPNFSNDQ
ncbi:MAG: flagellar filament capping protein FliD [Gammaproteobacteria bacterium]|nr:flagellar filament capping protein FliD [Gammaproteobacteria bacterium]